MYLSFNFMQKLSIAYNAACKPLCHELRLTQTAFDILMFLANNPEYKTASDIVEIRRLKANLVSINVERLVREGYLRREAVEGDRRKTNLICTEKAQPVIERGRAIQADFLEKMFADTEPADRQTFLKTMERVSRNLDIILKERE